MDIALRSNLEITQKQKMENIITESMEELKLNILKNILESKGIKYDNNITTYKELKKFLKSELNDTELKNIIEQEKINQNEVLSFIEILKDDATTDIQKIKEVAKENIVNPIARASIIAGISKLMYETIKIFPTPIKTIAQVTGVAGAVYKGRKAFLRQKKAEQTKLYNEIIEKLEVTKDDNGNIADTRFKDEQKIIIQKYFENQGLQIDINNYSEMKSNIKRLGNTKKLELINLINNSKGNIIDVRREITKNRKKINVKMIKNVFESILLSTAIGFSAASAVNSINESIISGTFNGVATKLFSKSWFEQTDIGVINSIKSTLHLSSKDLSNILGVITGASTELISWIPVIGEKAKDIFAAESLAIGGIAGLGAGTIMVTVKTLGSSIYKKGKELVKKVKMHFDKSNKRKKDEEIYKLDGERNLSENQKIMYEMIKQYLIEKGVQLPADVYSISQLKETAKTMNKKDKKELYYILNEMDKSLNEKDFSEKAKSILNTVGTSFTIAATGSLISDISGGIGHKMHETISENNEKKLISVKDKAEAPEPEIEAFHETNNDVIPKTHVHNSQDLPNETLPPNER